MDPASKWNKFKSIVTMSLLPELIPASEWYVIYLALPRSLYKVISAGQLDKICLAQPRSASKTAPAYKEFRLGCMYSM